MIKTIFKNKAISDGASTTDSISFDEINRLILNVNHTTAVTELAGVYLTLSTQDAVILRRLPLSILHAIAKQAGATNGSATRSVFPVGVGSLHLDDDEELTYLLENESGQTQTIDFLIEYNLHQPASVLRYDKRVDLSFSYKNVELIALTGTSMDEDSSLISITSPDGEESLPVLGYNNVMNADGPYDTMVNDFTILKEYNVPSNITVNASDLTIGANYFVIISSVDVEKQFPNMVRKAIARRNVGTLSSCTQRTKNSSGS